MAGHTFVIAAAAAATAATAATAGALWTNNGGPTRRSSFTAIPFGPDAGTTTSGSNGNNNANNNANNANNNSIIQLVKQDGQTALKMRLVRRSSEAGGGQLGGQLSQLGGQLSQLGGQLGPSGAQGPVPMPNVGRLGSLQTAAMAAKAPIGPIGPIGLLSRSPTHGSLLSHQDSFANVDKRRDSVLSDASVASPPASPTAPSLPLPIPIPTPQQQQNQQQPPAPLSWSSSSTKLVTGVSAEELLIHSI